MVLLHYAQDQRIFHSVVFNTIRFLHNEGILFAKRFFVNSFTTFFLFVVRFFSSKMNETILHQPVGKVEKLSSLACSVRESTRRFTETV